MPHSRRVSVQALYRFALWQVPEAQNAPSAQAPGRQCIAAVARHIDAPKTLLFMAEAAQLFPLLDIPHAHDAVITAEKGLLAVRRKAHPVDAKGALLHPP